MPGTEDNDNKDGGDNGGAIARHCLPTPERRNARTERRLSGAAGEASGRDNGGEQGGAGEEVVAALVLAERGHHGNGGERRLRSGGQGDT
jgi:hypothetical protein